MSVIGGVSEYVGVEFNFQKQSRTQYDRKADKNLAGGDSLVVVAGDVNINLRLRHELLDVGPVLRGLLQTSVAPGHRVRTVQWPVAPNDDPRMLSTSGRRRCGGKIGLQMAVG